MSDGPRILVVGGSGFTGRRVVTQLPRNAAVWALTRSDRSRSIVGGLRARPIVGDLDRPEPLRGAFSEAKPDVVICTASLGFGHAPGLLGLLADCGAPFTVFTSTTGIFTELNPESKAVRVAAEQLIADSGLQHTIVRPTMIYGRPGDRNLERLLAWLRRVPVVAAPNGGRSLLQPVHVDDLATTIVRAALDRQPLNRAVNVPGPSPLTFAELVHECGRALGRTARVVPTPDGLLRSVVGVQERVLPRPRLKVEQIDRLTEDKAFDVTEATELLGHAPRSFAEGIAEEARLLGWSRR